MKSTRQTSFIRSRRVLSENTHRKVVSRRSGNQQNYRANSDGLSKDSKKESTSKEHRKQRGNVLTEKTPCILKIISALTLHNLQRDAISQNTAWINFTRDKFAENAGASSVNRSDSTYRPATEVERWRGSAFQYYLINAFLVSRIG
jgi:hypothetical protein